MNSPLKDVLNNPESFPALFLETAMKTLNTQTDIISGPLHVISESNDTLRIDIDLPGIEFKDIKLHFQKNNMKVIGIRYKPNYIEDKDRLIKYGRISTEMKLPFMVTKKENVSTKLKNGVLSVTIKNPTDFNEFTIDCA